MGAITPLFGTSISGIAIQMFVHKSDSVEIAPAGTLLKHEELLTLTFLALGPGHR